MNTLEHDNHTKKQLALLQWRKDVIRHLNAKGCGEVAYDLKNCGCTFFVDICTGDVSHEPKAVPCHCGLRICPECAKRETWRLIAKYLPALQELLYQPLTDNYFLKKLVLTTPYALGDLTAETFKERMRLVGEFLQVYWFKYFLKRGELSKDEIRRGRCDLAKHMIGAIAAAEFGERGKKLHWHILIFSPYMPKEDVYTVWQDVTGGECKNVDLDYLYSKNGEPLIDGGDIIGAVKEIVKYSTKLTSLRPRDVPQLLKVLKGNRRFRSYGVLYNVSEPNDKEIDRVCHECGLERELTSVSEWLYRCEIKNVPPDDAVTDVIDSGILLYLSRDSEAEISSGIFSRHHHKARDSIESEV